MVTYDEVKRQANINNHGFDFVGSEAVLMASPSPVKTCVMPTVNCVYKRLAY